VATPRDSPLAPQEPPPNTQGNTWNTFDLWNVDYHADLCNLSIQRTIIDHRPQYDIWFPSYILTLMANIMNTNYGVSCISLNVNFVFANIPNPI